jgi:nitrite reductase (NADH) small subunit
MTPEPLAFRTAARVDEIADGRGRACRIGGRAIAVFRVGNDFFAMDDACPHEGIPLSLGRVHQGVVICPRHSWRFLLADGSWQNHPDSPCRARVYRVRVEGDEVQVEC